MAEYVDGFVIPVPKKQIDEYKKHARKFAKVWIEHGALSVRECFADDVPYGKVTSFPRSVERKNSETVVFSWITFKSRAHRDKVNKLVMADPRLEGMDPDTVPFDLKRMIYGGFTVGVSVDS